MRRRDIERYPAIRSWRALIAWAAVLVALALLARAVG